MKPNRRRGVGSKGPQLGPRRGSGQVDWSKTVCLVCDKTGGMDLEASHRRILIRLIKDNELTVKKIGAPAIHFKCEEKLNTLAKQKKGSSNVNRQEFGNVETGDARNVASDSATVR